MTLYRSGNCLRTPNIGAVLVVYMCLSLTPWDAAAQWRVEPTLAAGFELDDNARLSPEEFGEDSIEGYTTSVAANFLYQSPRTEFSLQPEFRLRRFDESDFNANDSFLEFRFNRAGQRSNFEIRGNYSDQTTRTGERSNVDFDLENPDEIPADDSGLTALVRDRQRLMVSPRWSYQFSERMAFSLGASYVDTTFENVGPGSGQDFSMTIGEGALEFNASERDTLSLWGYYRSNDFEANNRGDVSGNAFGARYTRSISEQTEFRLGVGVDQTDVETGETVSNSVGDVALVHRFETGRILASYQRVVGGSGAAVLSVRDAINISGRRQFSDRLAVGLGVRVYRTDAIEDVLGSEFDQREFAQLRTLVNWRATRVISVELDYQLTFLERDSFPSGATSNHVTFWLKYSPIL